MIEDLSNSVKALLEYELLTPGQEIIPNLSISFAQPDQNFPPASVTKPAVNIFLYDVPRGSETAPTTNGFVISRYRPQVLR